jgi:hypothetical protein
MPFIQHHYVILCLGAWLTIAPFLICRLLDRLDLYVFKNEDCSAFMVIAGGITALALLGSWVICMVILLGRLWSLIP